MSITYTVINRVYMNKRVENEGIMEETEFEDMGVKRLSEREGIELR